MPRAMSPSGGGEAGRPPSRAAVEDVAHGVFEQSGTVSPACPHDALRAANLSRPGAGLLRSYGAAILLGDDRCEKDLFVEALSSGRGAGSRGFTSRSVTSQWSH